jgi:signal transduction histidine kinase
LIGNAFKFTLEGEIAVYVCQKEPKVITVKVKDTGIGIRENDKP